ncbi:MAG: hypothetical protein AAGJ81_01350 [Verrucomicrobiota bacterium]
MPPVIGSADFGQSCFSDTGKRLGIVLVCCAVTVLFRVGVNGDEPRLKETQVKGLEQAVVSLALENASRFREAGDIKIADALERQAKGFRLGRDSPLRAVPKNLLPTVPEWEGNPYVEGALAEIDSQLSKPDKEFLLGEAGVKQFIPGESDVPLKSRTIADEMRLFAWAGLHPKSPYRGDPEVLKRALRRAHAYTDAYNRTETMVQDLRINDFFACYSMMDALLILKTGCPDLLLPIQRERWDETAERAGAFWYAFIDDNHNGWYSENNPRGFGSFCNHNVTEGMIVQFAGMYLGNEKYKEVGSRVVAMQRDNQYPDGAFAYIRNQNEILGYHGVNIEKFVRHYELTGDPIAKELLLNSRNYYPLTVEPGNTNEWWSNPVWKYQWNSSGYGPYQDIIAGITGCPYSKAIAKQELEYRGGKINHIIAAPYYRSSIEAADLPTDFFVFDRNIQGPRSRFGRFATAMVGRDYGNDDSGKMAFAGCMVIDPIDHRRHPLNAAVKAIYPRVRLRDNSEDWRDCAYLSHDERTTVSTGHSFGSLATSHDLARTAPAQATFPVDWSANQQWISLPDRIIGMVEVFPKDGHQSAYGVSGRIRLGYGRAGPLRPKEMEKVDDLNYEYGDLKIRLYENNYEGISTEVSGILRDSARNATEIVLTDSPEGESERRRYSEDERRFFTVEAMPEWAEPADSVEVIREGDVRGLEIAVETSRYLILHNISDEDASYTADLASWRLGNPVFQFEVNADNSNSPVQPIRIMELRPNLTIPPHSHFVLATSPNPEDLQPGLYDFGQLLL